MGAYMKNPEISVIMGMYNCADTLSEAIESILNQTMKEWELIMCDDGSSDATYEVAELYMKRYPEKMILLRNRENRGLNYTLNRCLKAAKGKLPVVRVPAYSPYAVAEYSLALMLSLNRKIHRAYWRTRDGNFSLNGLMGFDMHGKTIGIIGTGKIAKILIRLLKGFGMRILAYDLYPDMKFAGEEGISYVSLDELYRESDIISLHCPLTDQTKYMIDKDSIDKMKEGVMIINTGRGQLINTNDLIEGLKEKKIAAAGLDVYEEEGEYFYEDKSDKIIDDDVLARLLSFNNVIVTSHQAFFTKEALHNIAETTLQNIEDFRCHRPLVNEVIL